MTTRVERAMHWLEYHGLYAGPGMPRAIRADQFAAFADDECASLEAERAAQAATTARLRAALEFYALPGMGDNGLRARQALAPDAGRAGIA